MTKTTEYKTKKKKQREATANEADALIKDFLEKNYYHNKKTEEILIDYIKRKSHHDENQSD